MPNDDPNKNALADALSAMSRGEAPPGPAGNVAGGQRPTVPRVAFGAPVHAYGQRAQEDETLAIAPLNPHWGARKLQARDPMNGTRTLIPILLTSGVLLIGIALYILLSGGGEEGIYDVFPHWTSVVLIAGGVMVLGIAAHKMNHVRKAMRGGVQDARPNLPPSH